jgi:hypothetical protein
MAVLVVFLQSRQVCAWCQQLIEQLDGQEGCVVRVPVDLHVDRAAGWYVRYWFNH